jgi:hypothetical protein
MVVRKSKNSGKLGSRANPKCGTASSDVISFIIPYRPGNIMKIFMAHILLYLKNEAPKMRSMHIPHSKGEPDHAEQKTICRKP